MAKREELVVGLDIGTTKIAAIVGELTEEGGVDVIGVGTHPSTGLKKGVVVNIDATVQSIQRAVEEAEHMAGVEITSVYAGIAGAHIKSLNSQGVWAVKEKEVKEADIAAVLEQAKAINIPQDREIIHVLPQEYTIDHQDGIKEPVGMSGVRLEAKVHLVTASVSSAQNIIKCCHRCGLQVADVVLEPLASAEAVLHDDEKELGVALIDIGGGTTDIAIFTDGAIVHSSVLAVGGHQLTADIAYGLRSPHSEAERIKHKHGCAMLALVGDEEIMDVPSVGGRPARQVKRQSLAAVIEPRVEEIFMLVKRELEKTGYEDKLASGAVICGGSTILEGMPELAEEVLGMPVRRGTPMGVGGLVDVVKSPAYATAVGLVRYGMRNMGAAHFGRGDADKRGVWQRMRSWFGEVF
jgi:cell division protein FtsA